MKIISIYHLIRGYMIKLGCQSLSYQREFAAGQLDLFGFLQRAYELGLDGVDIHFAAFASTDSEYLRRVRMYALERGLVFSYIGISNDFGKPVDVLDGEIKKVKHWIDIAVLMGIPLVRVFCANLPPGEDEESILARDVSCLKQVADYGQEKGVVVGLQNHNHHRITRTGQDVLRIIEMVDNPYFGHILDTGQYIGSPGAGGSGRKPDPAFDFYSSIADTAPLALHVRAKFYMVKTGAETWLDYPRILKILRDAGYNGWISVVYEGKDAEPEAIAVPKAVEYLRSLIR